MLKIKDASGKVVGVLKDEDNAPDMKSEPVGTLANPEEEVVETKEGESDGDSNDGDV